MSAGETLDQKCSTCPFEEGCVQANPLVQIVNIPFEPENPTPMASARARAEEKAYKNAMAQQGIVIEDGGICIEGLVAQYSNADGDWLRAQAWVIHHDYGLRARREARLTL